MTETIRIALSMRQAEQATGLGHTKFYSEVTSRRLKTYTVGRRRFTTPEWLREWQQDRAAESAEAEDAEAVEAEAEDRKDEEAAAEEDAA